jgi:phosphatidylglycerophosphate synthase
VIEVQQKLLNRQLEKFLRDTTSKIKYMPSLFSGLRIVVLPFLAYSFFVGLGFVASAIFLWVIGTDFADGYLARKLGTASK